METHHLKVYNPQIIKVGENKVLVVDAELVFVEYMTAALPNCIIDTTNVCIDGKCYKPILISRTEKIEKGDWVESEGLIGKCTSIDSKFYYLEIGKNDIVSRRKDSCFKILALPEHFSPKHLQAIVDGKLKEGKCLVECEDKGGYRQDSMNGCWISKYQIKLNPHITIYPVKKEQIWSDEDVLDMLIEFATLYHNLKYKDVGNDAAEFLADKKRFEQNVK